MRLTLLLSLVISLHSFLYSQPYRIAIIPFTINAEEDLSHINDGIYELLSSRLSKKDTAIIISRDETEKSLENVEKIHGESLALIAGAKLQADYVIYGSLTFSTQDSSVIVNVTDVSGVKPLHTFSRDIRAIDEVIPQVNLFATDINSLILHGEIKTAEDPVKPPQVQARPSAEEKSIADTISDSTKPLPYSEVFSKDFWGSEIFKIRINGIALGDVDNDKKIETIVLTPRRVTMYRCVDKKLEKIKDIKKISNRYPIGIDVADINGNGIPEILVTALDMSQTRVTSFALEYDGKQFKTICRHIPFYLRVAKTNDTAHTLIGQVGSLLGPFNGKVYEMKWDKKKYVRKKQILPSRNINVLGLAYGNIMNKGNNSIVAYDNFDNVKVIGSSRDVVWEGNEALGGSTLYFKSTQDKEASAAVKFNFLPMRLQIEDINKDGLFEVIAVKNYATAARFFGNLKYFKKSHIEILAWDGYGLASMWKSKIISNYLRDFAVGDFDNDGKNEFVAALVLREGKAIFVKPKSSIIAYELK